MKYVLIALGLAVCGSAHAFSCAPTQGNECRIELSTVTIVFDAGIANFDGDSQFNGSDGYVHGFTVGAGQFPELTLVDHAGGTRVGFSFAPGMIGVVGGSGIEGTHEAFAYFAFTGLQFIARNGYRVDGVEFAIDGARTTVGNGYVGLTVPGVPVFSGDQFSARGLYATNTAQYWAGFTASASYEEGEDGTAVNYGTASAEFTAASLVAHVSAVPEPSTAGLSALGALMLGVAMRRGRVARRNGAAT
jgi:hypothetical protein